MFIQLEFCIAFLILAIVGAVGGRKTFFFGQLNGFWEL
jgi:hypothetical protein